MGMFEVDPKGLRKLLAGRDYGFTINELAQNAFDEYESEVLVGQRHRSWHAGGARREPRSVPAAARGVSPPLSILSDGGARAVFPRSSRSAAAPSTLVCV